MSDNNIPENLIKVFLNEARDVIDNLEMTLDRLKSDVSNGELLNEIFRGVHTLKGNSAMFGYNSIECVLHQFENLFDKARHHKFTIKEDTIDLTFCVVDFVKDVLFAESIGNDQIEERMTSLISQIEGVLSDEITDDVEMMPKDIRGMHTFYIYFKPIKEIFNFGANPLYSVLDLHDIGSVKVYSISNEVPSYNHFMPLECNVGWHILLYSDKTLQAIRDEFVFVENECTLEIIELATDNLLKGKSFSTLFEKNLDKFNELDIDHVKAVVGEYYQQSAKNQSIENVEIGKQQVASIRVEGEKIDQLMNRVSELITTQATLNLISDKQRIPELKEVSEKIDKIVKQLREITFDISLVPLSQSFSRFNRLVREVSAKLGKRVDFHIDGSDTALEKSMISNIIDPIMHIIRNAIDHGIENIEDRMAKGKDEHGSISLNAYYEGNTVVIEVSDDGRGIDVEKIKSAAIKRGLLQANEKYSKNEILDVLFIPGFSTAESVTEVSGRGVGMDVVKRKIDELRGEVTILTQEGKGTTTKIALPATTSIVDTMHVRVNDKSYLVPIADVAYCEELTATNKILSSTGGCFNVNGEAIVLLSLREMFHIKSDFKGRSKVLILSQDNTKIALEVDAILGTHQAVLKPLGDATDFNQLFSAASVLGDGTLALVLDTHKLFKTVTQYSATLHQ